MDSVKVCLGSLHKNALRWFSDCEPRFWQPGASNIQQDDFNAEILGLSYLPEVLNSSSIMFDEKMSVPIWRGYTSVPKMVRKLTKTQTDWTTLGFQLDHPGSFTTKEKAAVPPTQRGYLTNGYQKVIGLRKFISFQIRLFWVSMLNFRVVNSMYPQASDPYPPPRLAPPLTPVPEVRVMM